MAEPFLSEIRIFSFNFAPKGWALCNGQLLSINQNQALFSLIGTMYGGDGRTTFGLPNLQGRVSIGAGGFRQLGSQGGEQTHTLTAMELAAHTHGAKAAGTTTDTNPIGHYWAPDIMGNVTFATTPNVALDPTAIANTGGGQAHLNMQPYLTLNFCIALQGIFPPDPDFSRG
jgi:microcystin-dependent protein